MESLFGPLAAIRSDMRDRIIAAAGWVPQEDGRLGEIDRIMDNRGPMARGPSAASVMSSPGDVGSQLLV
jgi:hypothetical protein